MAKGRSRPPGWVVVDPELQKLRDALDAATRKASDAYAAFKQAKEEAETKGVDLLKDDKAFRPIQDLPKAYQSAKVEAEKARAEYMGALEGHVPGGGSLGTKAERLDGSWPTNVSDAWAENVGAKALDVTSGGTMVPAFFDPEIRLLPQRRLFIRSIIPSTPTTGDKFDFLRQTVYTNNAAPVAAGALKPTSVISLERVEDAVRTIAHLSEAVDRSLLSDMDQLRPFLDGALRLGVLLAEENQIINGNGTPPNLRGISRPPAVSFRLWGRILG
jgi:HK97 family phage major capsid protein